MENPALIVIQNQVSAPFVEEIWHALSIVFYLSSIDVLQTQSAWI